MRKRERKRRKGEWERAHHRSMAEGSSQGLAMGELWCSGWTREPDNTDFSQTVAVQGGERHQEQHLKKITGRGRQLEGGRRWEGEESNVVGRGQSQERGSPARRGPASEKISRAKRGSHHCYHSRLGGFAALTNVGLAQGWASTPLPPEDSGSEGRLTRITRPSTLDSQKKCGLYTFPAVPSLQLPFPSETSTPSIHDIPSLTDGGS